MNFPTLKIGRFIPKYPIIQGGMAVRVSTAPLAGAVGNAGGIGVIGATGMEPEELRDEIRQARAISPNGIIGINIMYAAREFAKIVRTAIEEKIDIIFTGAGFSRDIFSWGKESDTPIVSIVSSAKVAKMAEKLGASAVVAEGTEAGGHLGTDLSIKDILPEIRKAVKIPVIAAGGITDGKGIAEMLRLGADGVQLATRFVMSVECTVSDAFKKHYMNATADDVVTILSPVGLPGRALKNSLVSRIHSGNAPEPENCQVCLKHCSQSFCIMDALMNSRDGNIEDGLVFCGQNVHRIKDILPVSTIFDRLITEVAEA
ncbi:NAD(P)H-dependent flavin oxidoreductase [Desulforamulus aquiferis]|uniref:Probable nitronate monooxygenase n=1 Tax=Desulforamulus aquiferis TaxID=1397668 RepID=A0AAW7Z8K7_9FIRM|nr:nitronate monooxygenase [Desulforamulus aquiferis]MDO7785634.1 nitronate monooxygenase [Desulforamulus aquiferis]RYD03220.1 2-nitropropane dioxygenase [Desulforamulus aquiferis]